MLARASLALHASRFVADALAARAREEPPRACPPLPASPSGPSPSLPNRYFSRRRALSPWSISSPSFPVTCSCARVSGAKVYRSHRRRDADLWQTVAVVQRALERAHATTSSTLAIQDGPLAGQTVPHVHVHVLEARGDFAQRRRVRRAGGARGFGRRQATAEHGGDDRGGKRVASVVLARARIENRARERVS